MALPEKLNVLELFCGIGGMHYALQESGLDFEVKCAVDINTVTNAVYQHNFPSQPLAQREIQSLTLKEIENLGVNTLLMSPPCQPFTRVGLKKDLEDQRTDAFISILQLLDKLSSPISYVLVENVKGFEDSLTRDQFISTLSKKGYIYQEFLLTPLQFSIPNSRLRYYCIAKHQSKGGHFVFPLVEQVQCKVPDEALHYLLDGHKYIDIDILENSETCDTDSDVQLTAEQITSAIDNDERISLLGNFLESSTQHASDYLLCEKGKKHYQGLDIRTANSRNSCCFTKRYGHYFVGSGSFISTGNKLEDDTLELRHFTPEEIARLLCFPQKFRFPDSTTRKQRYRSLGNSLNVYIVANLIRLMTLSL